MLNYYKYYKKNEKAFREYVKLNPCCSKEEWDKYAQENCLYSANTLMFHFFHSDLIKYLNKKNTNKFEYLKDMFLFIPIKYRNNKISSTLLKINRSNRTKEKEVKNG